MHRMSNVNKFKDSYQVLKKNYDFVSWKKKFKDSEGMSKQFFFAQDVYHKHLMCYGV
jgi:hypothetical protein